MVHFGAQETLYHKIVAEISKWASTGLRSTLALVDGMADVQVVHVVFEGQAEAYGRFISVRT